MAAIAWMTSFARAGIWNLLIWDTSDRMAGLADCAQAARRMRACCAGSEGYGAAGTPTDISWISLSRTNPPTAARSRASRPASSTRWHSFLFAAGKPVDPRAPLRQLPSLSTPLALLSLHREREQIREIVCRAGTGIGR